MSASHHAIVFVGKEGRLTTPFPSKKLPIYESPLKSPFFEAPTSKML